MVRCAEACDFLLQRCVEKGAHDNLSALLVMCGVHDSTDRSSKSNCIKLDTIIPSIRSRAQSKIDYGHGDVGNGETPLKNDQNQGNAGIAGNQGDEGYPNGSLTSPGPTPPRALFLGSPSSGARDRTPVDSTLSRVFAADTPEGDANPNDSSYSSGDSGTNTHVNRQLGFNEEFR